MSDKPKRNRGPILYAYCENRDIHRHAKKRAKDFPVVKVKGKRAQGGLSAYINHLIAKDAA